MDSYNVGYGITGISWGWYLDSGDGYERVGGHVVTYLGSNGEDQIIIGNPAPFVKGVNPEYLDVYRGTEADGEALEGGLLIDISAFYPNTAIKAMVESIQYLIVDADPSETTVATSWEISGIQKINTNGAYLTVQAPIYGSGTLVKGDFGSEDGMLVLTAGAGGEENPYTYTGGTYLLAGVLAGRMV